MYPTAYWPPSWSQPVERHLEVLQPTTYRRWRESESKVGGPSMESLEPERGANGDDRRSMVDGTGGQRVNPTTRAPK
eukprot:scaffold71330_cov32-Tisochrysis_lutea.AAC.9